MDPSVLPFVLDGHAKTLALLGAGWLVARTFARGNAERRHTAYALAFALALAAPILALLPARGSVINMPLAKSTHVRVASESRSVPERPVEPNVWRPVDPEKYPNQTLSSITNESKTRYTSSKAPEPGNWAVRFGALFAALPSMLVWIWITGVAAFFLRLLTAHGIAALGVLAGDPVVSGVGPSIARLVAREYGLAETPRLLTSRAARVPYAFGVLNVDVVVPEESELWSGETWSLVLRHELAHARRRDGLWHLLAAIVCALNWFNPLVWREAARLRRESERACDDWVLNSGAKPSSYATLLVDFARSVGQGPSAAMAIARPSDLAERIEAILDPAIAHKPSGGISMKKFAIIFAAALIAASLVNVRVVANENGKPSKSEPKVVEGVALAPAEESKASPCIGEAWNAVAWDAHNAKLWDYSALAWGNAAKLGHATATSEYNVACGYARLGKKDEAIEWLTQAFADGFGNDDLAREDEDMATLKDDPRFEAAISTLPTAAAKKWLKDGGEAVARWASSESTPEACDAKEEAQRAADRAEWQTFVDSVGPLERQLPDSGSVRFRLGFALLILDRPEEALERFQAAKRLGEEEEKSQYNIACCYARMGKKAEAIAALKELVKSDDHHWYDAAVGPEAMAADYDLRTLRDEPEFKALVEEMTRNQHRQIKGVDWRKVWSGLRDTTGLEEVDEVATTR